MKSVNRFCVFATIVASANIFTVLPSLADQSSIISSCTTGVGDTASVISRHVDEERAGGASDQQVDRQLVNMTEILGEAALQSPSASDRRRLALCVSQLSALVTNPTQRSQVERIAIAIQSEGQDQGTSASAN